MAITMTRKEYEAKYGVAPVIPSASKVDVSVAPVKMTRAEYNSRYITPPEKKGFDVLGGAKSAVNTLKTEFGGGEQGIANKLAKNVEEGGQRYAAEAEKGNIGGATKELLKTGFRTAGDVAGAVYAPVGAAIEATGVNKLFDAFGELSQKGKYNPIKMLTDIPAVQEWVMKHPNAADDFGRAMNLALGAMDSGKINPETAVARTAEQVKAIPEKIKTEASAVKEKINTINQNLKVNKNNKITKAISDEIGNIENNYVKTRKANEFSKDSGAASRTRIAQTDVLTNAVDAEGTIRTKQPGGAIDKYKAQTIDGMEGVVRENLSRLSEKVNLEQVKKNLTMEVNRSGLEGADLLTALNGIEKEIAGLKLKADTFGNIPLTLAHDAKINTTRNINYQTPPETATYRKAVARGYKKVVEENSAFDVKQVNAELAKYYDDISRLENLDGRKVKGGKLGKYFAQISGNIVGGAAGSIGGPLGTAIGTIVGGEAAGFIKGKNMARTFGAERGVEAPRNLILEQAKALGKEPAAVDLTIPSKRVGAGKAIQKTKEVYRLENDIANNVKQQKAAIAAKDFTLVAKLKEVYDVLVSALKEVIQKFKDTPNKEGGFINIGGKKFSRVPDATKAEMVKVIDYLRIGKEYKGAEGDLSKLSEKYNINPDWSNEKIANTFEGLVDKTITTESYSNSFGNRKAQYNADKTIAKTASISKSISEGLKIDSELSPKKEIIVKDINGNKFTLKQGEPITAYQKGSNFVVNDKIINKGQYENLKGQSTKIEAKEFAPELKGTEETIKESATSQAEKNKILDKKFKDGEISNEEYLKQRGIISDTKYSQYTLPDGKNYKEILIQAPETLKKGEYGTDVIDKSQTFKSSHWNEPNVISHIRMNERTYNGKKVSFMEELQSDWARENRQMENKAKSGENFIPQKGHPLLKNWQELSIKRALKEAVNNKSDYFSWINGEQTAARYNLSTQVDKINWFDPTTAKSGKKTVEITPKGGAGKRFEFEVNKDGIITQIEDGVPSDWKGKNVADVIGKGLGEKIVASTKGTLEGEGLNVGGEWAKNLYDKQVKSIVENLTGQKTETLDLGLSTTKPFKQNWLFEDRDGAIPVTKDNIKVGDRISNHTRNEFIVTDILSNGMFKAMPKETLSNYLDGKTPKEYLDLKSYEKRLMTKNNLPAEDSWVKKMVADRKRFLDNSSAEFDLNDKPVKKTTQQGIKITPQVKAIVKGEKPPVGKPNITNAAVFVPLIFTVLGLSQNKK